MNVFADKKIIEKLKANNPGLIQFVEDIVNTQPIDPNLFKELEQAILCSNNIQLSKIVQTKLKK